MRKFAIAAFALVLPVAASAEVHHFAVDAVHSAVGFKARHLVATTPGRFNEFAGSVWAGSRGRQGHVEARGPPSRPPR